MIYLGKYISRKNQIILVNAKTIEVEAVDKIEAVKKLVALEGKGEILKFIYLKLL